MSTNMKCEETPSEKPHEIDSNQIAGDSGIDDKVFEPNLNGRKLMVMPVLE